MNGWNQFKLTGTVIVSVVFRDVKAVLNQNILANIGPIISVLVAISYFLLSLIDFLSCLPETQRGKKKIRGISEVFTVACETPEMETVLPLLISITRWLLINCSDGIMICCQIIEEWGIRERVDFFFLPRYLSCGFPWTFPSEEKGNVR